MRRVRVQRVIQDAGREFVSLGRPFEGLEPALPTVGREYLLYEDSGKLIRTSFVVKVHKDFFETRNSFYKITVLDQEPFDLGGGKPPQRTQEIEFPTAGTTAR